MKNIWENFYKKNNGNNFPHHAVITFYYRHFYKINKKLSFLDLGAGSGSSLKLFKKKNIYLDMVDISPSAIKKIKTKYKACNVKLINSSFNDYLKTNKKKYNWIIDATSLQHQSLEQIKESYNLIYQNLKKGGYFLSLHLSHSVNLNNNAFPVLVLSKNKIIQLFKKNKFKDIDYNYFVYSENNSKNKIKFNVVSGKN